MADRFRSLRSSCHRSPDQSPTWPAAFHGHYEYKITLYIGKQHVSVLALLLLTLFCSGNGRKSGSMTDPVADAQPRSYFAAPVTGQSSTPILPNQPV